jgi:hypothetical protein
MTRHDWFLVLLLAVPCACDLYMIVEYDTNGTARPVGINFTLHTVELHVTLLGCDHGYYAETVQPLVCKECACTDFTEGRVEAFVEDKGI